MSTTVDQFQAALHSLAGHGAIKDRLCEAYRNHLSLIEKDDLPGELREEFQLLVQILTREPAQLRGEDAVHATVRKMSSDEAAEAASAIVRMFAAVSRSPADSFRIKSAKSGLSVVPLYVAEA